MSDGKGQILKVYHPSWVSKLKIKFHLESRGETGSVYFVADNTDEQDALNAFIQKLIDTNQFSSFVEGILSNHD